MNWNFEWHDEKAKENLKKHKISFEEATTVFNDPFSITIHDPDHSLEEDRYIDIGTSSKGRLLVAVYVERGTKVRIISCLPACLRQAGRRATASERRMYEEGNI